MNRFFKILAIAVLAITVAAAGAVLYGVTMFEPKVESVAVMATPADQAQAVFDTALRQAEEGTFAGELFTSVQDLTAQDCTFLTYTVRLSNRGFFPAEWIMLEVEPRQSADGASRDVLQMAEERAHVLSANSRGDLSATVLRAGDASDTARNLKITCYVFGRRVELFTAAP